MPASRYSLPCRTSGCCSSAAVATRPALRRRTPGAIGCSPLGWVDDLDDVLLAGRGLISPLRIGSGIKIKVLEALARGLPVVATPHGVLGLDVGPDDGCLVAA